ncbi:MAG TPA: hypothetical protein VGZ23_16140 [bacterium]|nr:hypothetical protein [bacterium]
MTRGMVTRWRVLSAVVGLFAGVLLLAGVAPAATPAPAPTVQEVKVYLFPDSSQMIKGPDGRTHDAFVPYSFVLHAGTPVRFTIINYDDMPHTMTAPDLDLNIMLKPGLDLSNGNITPGITTYTFTPSKKGTFRWSCVIPCDTGNAGWAMAVEGAGLGRIGYQAGYIDVI